MICFNKVSLMSIGVLIVFASSALADGPAATANCRPYDTRPECQRDNNYNPNPMDDDDEPCIGPPGSCGDSDSSYNYDQYNPNNQRTPPEIQPYTPPQRFETLNDVLNANVMDMQTGTLMDIRKRLVVIINTGRVDQYTGQAILDKIYQIDDELRFRRGYYMQHPPQ